MMSTRYSLSGAKSNEVGFGGWTRDVKTAVGCLWGRMWCQPAGTGPEPLSGGFFGLVLPSSREDIDK